MLSISKGLPPILSCSPEASLFRAVVDMVKMRSGAMMVCDSNGDTVGIVTERDVLDKHPFDVGVSRKMKVTDIMTPSSRLVTAPSSSTLDQCIKMMHTRHLRHLPIVEGDDTKGLLSMRYIAQVPISVMTYSSV